MSRMRRPFIDDDPRATGGSAAHSEWYHILQCAKKIRARLDR
jgi:hypothetical protein